MAALQGQPVCFLSFQEHRPVPVLHQFMKIIIQNVTLTNDQGLFSAVVHDAAVSRASTVGTGSQRGGKFA
jgi:hypothetical protein